MLRSEQQSTVASRDMGHQAATVQSHATSVCLSTGRCTAHTTAQTFVTVAYAVISDERRALHYSYMPRRRNPRTIAAYLKLKGAVTSSLATHPSSAMQANVVPRRRTLLAAERTKQVGTGGSIIGESRPCRLSVSRNWWMKAKIRCMITNINKQLNFERKQTE